MKVVLPIENTLTQARFEAQLIDILDGSKVTLSNIKPSEWAELNRIMGSGESQFEGRFSYDLTPYCREIVDCMSPDHPGRIFIVMKGSQIGFSTGVIEPGIGWTIAENPGNILFLTGHTDLAEEAIEKLDVMIDSCGIRHLIKPQAMRAKASKTGDTNSKKEFAGGKLVSGGASNHKLLRQRSIKIAFIDDFDAAKKSTKESGSTWTMIKQRLAAYYFKMKIFVISTPELKETSNTEPLYLDGDQRRYFIPCPCCGDMIYLEWSIPVKNKEGEMGGITWKVDDTGRLIEESVGYICQECGDFFTDANKQDLLKLGVWKPTAEPKQPDMYSYHISSLYAPHGMYDWKYYVREFLSANPANGPRDEKLHQAFVNLVLGQTYEPTGETASANALQKNIRPYDVGIIPEKLSISDGNGSIVMVTCACDLNGTLDDARLDYEILAHSESGATYSVTHGSIGTFIPKEKTILPKNQIDRTHWTYETGATFSVWKELDTLLKTPIKTDGGVNKMVYITGIDCGYLSEYAYDYISRASGAGVIVGLKGKDTNKAVSMQKDAKLFRQALERSDLYLVESNIVKDRLAEYTRLKWDPRYNDSQPANFMNFPTPSDGKYLFMNYFSHYEAEHKVLDKDKQTFIWQKKDSNVQNHLYDCRNYGLVLRDILVSLVCKELKITHYTWDDYVKIMNGGK